MIILNSKKIKQMLKDDNVSFDQFYDVLRDVDKGFWDGVNDTEIIKQYLSEMINKGIHVSHIVEALETNPSEHDLYQIWLGNSMETPSPINNKNDLYNALFA